MNKSLIPWGDGASAAWVVQAVERTFKGSVLAGLLSSSAWASDGDAAEARLAELTEALSWATPLGFAMPSAWRGFSCSLR